MTSKAGQHMGFSSVGLSSKQALAKLQCAIEEELDKHQQSVDFRAGLLPAWACDAFHHSSLSATFPWTSALLLACDVFLLILYQIYRDAGFHMQSLALETAFLFLLLLLNLSLVAWDSRLRHTEMLRKIQATLKEMKGGHHDSYTYLGRSILHAPPSPCISRQWTFRDGLLLPLPSSLLVEGDTLLMRPGHPAPGRCKGVKDEVLESGEIFAPTDEDQCEDFFHNPRLRKPYRPAKFVLMETPCLTSIRCALENSLKRPVTLFNKEYHAVVFYYMEKIILPATLMVVLCAGSLRAVYFDWKGDGEWAEHLLLRPVLSTLPSLPLTLPLCWLMMNAAGNARLMATVHSKQCSKRPPVDPFDDPSEEEEGSVGVEEGAVKWWEVRGLLLQLLTGGGGHLWRSANLLQVMGSVTALCCVDKKGVLSWPNPTAEKVFFLRAPRSKSGSSCEDNCCPTDDEDKSRTDHKDHIYHPGSQVEVLDLTHNLHSPFGIQFDDPNWKIYADNLKPLGLGILLNTCNPKAQEHYTAFSDHIACESLFNESAVPVVNKRCLCELAKQIGFMDSVVDYYDLQQLIGIFRHVHPEVVQKGRLARSLNFPRLKMPFPNMTCAILKDLHRGSHQLFSQGTADLILDACNEYWDGNDIRLLTDSDRKRILDFYHRSSLTAHCMGYAYCPLSNNNNNNTLPTDGKYVELPAEAHHLLSSLEANTASPRSWDPPCLKEGGSHPLHRHLSSDSLVLPEQPSPDGATLDTSLRQLGNAIFIGMVTMQYQACPDFVQLIEQLDKACIRFVHFSKENELRSRVFSEKMGLESGWNCHISLLSDKPSSEDNKVASPPKFSQHYNFPPPPVEEPSPTENRSEITCRHASAPSVIHLESGDIKSEDTSSQFQTEDSTSVCNVPLPTRLLRSGSLSEECVGRRESSLQELFSSDNVSQSPSHGSTEQSAPVTFDMSNRAKLPKGTENIRPHIEQVDNVPLQVSLFTDCTPGATREMVAIMQEYGEVVCCVGSAANTHNLPLFLQADASIAMDPLFPQLCSSISHLPQPSEHLERLSSSLNSLPCCLLFHREDPVSLHHLIMEARHFMWGVRNSLEFFLCCSLCLVVVQLAGAVFFLPLTLPLSHLLWMQCLLLPLLSLSLMLANPPTRLVHTLATGKNLKATNKQAIVLFATCFCVRFCPSAVVALFAFACALSAACVRLTDASGVCWLGDDIGKTEKKFSAESWFAALTVTQNVFSFFLVLFFIVISLSFVHRSRPLWRNNPFHNIHWICIVASLLCVHVLFCVGDVALHVKGEPAEVLYAVPYYVWLVGGLWPLIAIPINELVRRHEIKVNVRQQKRARLEFCTKLGMNSPF